ncbi:MAG: Hsp20/alpha crystallin family protein [Patescibacteria group bacterium]|nr:Hsp20/alpha crystallin family protein [Patescibacteria group bacterium]
MPIIPWRPFWDIERWFEEEWPEWEWPEFRFPRIVPRVPMRTPRMDIYETDGEVVAEVELPGVDPKNIEVEVKDNYLRVEAKAEEKKEEKKKGYYRKEISAGYYKRVVPLPTEVIGEKAEAEYAEGILKVVIPKKKPVKKEEKKPIKIKVKGAKLT